MFCRNRSTNLKGIIQFIAVRCVNDDCFLAKVALTCLSRGACDVLICVLNLKILKGWIQITRAKMQHTKSAAILDLVVLNGQTLINLLTI